VGAFGIDGGMSTMLGQSYATDELCFLVIGDLAFYYDMNSLGNRHIKNNVRILLVNNNGGVEFKINTIHEEIDVSRYISADNHFKTAKSWAEENGFLYLSAKTKDEFSEISSQFVSLSNRPILFEVFTLPNDEREALRIIRNSCRNRSQEELKTKQSNERKKAFLSKILGETGVEIVKKLMR
jgi:2-succinyl-5-enolpyruvyl-6-hydroxy-3-cyclohexene-1-carboxylate synthase